MPHATQMSAADTGLLVVDVQEKLLPKVLSCQRLESNIGYLIDAARLLEMPVLCTEQYPKGLGPTVASLAARLPDRPEKLAFSACAAPGIVESFHRLARPRVVVCGIETHVCVLHTVLDLLAEDFSVYIPVDAVGARYEIDHAIALSRLVEAGAVVTTTEGCLFEWVGGAAHPKFKDISRLVQDRMKTLA